MGTGRLPVRAAAFPGGLVADRLRLFRAEPALPAVPVVEVWHDGRSYRVAVKRDGRARRLTLRVRPASREAILTMPAGASLRAARGFVERHAEWIGRRLDHMPGRIPMQDGSTIPFRGVETRIVRAESLRAAAWIETRPDPDGTAETVLVTTGTAEQQSRRLLDLFRKEARRDLEAAARRHAAAIRRPIASITLRDTRSRWGSCTARGALNFSWRLILAPPLVLDYLAAHEVAHLVHMNHSAAYWALAERLAPDLDRAEAWLKAHGASLHRYG